jgi:hypothetical protein
MSNEARGAHEAVPAAVGARVVVAVYEHKHGTDVRAFQGDEGALNWRRSIAEYWWDHEFDDERPLEVDIGAAYFEKIEGEVFSVHDLVVTAE